MDTLDEARQLTGEDRHWLKRMEDSFSALSHWLETDGQVTAEFRGTVPEIGRNVVAAFLMTGEAMKLWNQRRLKQR